MAFETVTASFQNLWDTFLLRNFLEFPVQIPKIPSNKNTVKMLATDWNIMLHTEIV